jgi:hypothetical protein
VVALFLGLVAGNEVIDPAVRIVGFMRRFADHHLGIEQKTVHHHDNRLAGREIRGGTRDFVFQVVAKCAALRRQFWWRECLHAPGPAAWLVRRQSDVSLGIWRIGRVLEH